MKENAKEKDIMNLKKICVAQDAEQN